jgi:glycosyltransferase involved in cell wall biosynthesis
MDYPKISIVTPSYNQAVYLEDTLTSLLSQQYPNLELIVIDGGSTDGSVDVIKKYADKITYWVSEKDNGQYEAINKGFSHTTGDIMGWLNSSDVYYPWTLKTVAEIFTQNQTIDWISGMPSNLSTGMAPQSISRVWNRSKYDIIGGNYKWIQQESLFWKRRLWEKAGGKIDVSIRNAADLDLWIKFFDFADLYYVNTILAGFRYHDDRRSDDVGGVYLKEAASQVKKFIGRSSFGDRVKGGVIKLLVNKSEFRKRVIKKTVVFKWYKHGDIYFDYSTDKWVAKLK